MTSRRLGIVATSLLLIMLVGCRRAPLPDIPWRGSFPLALEAAVQENKPLLVYWNAEWCTICRRIEQESFSDKDVAVCLGSFIPVKVDIDKDTLLAIRYRVNAVPAFMMIDMRGKLRGHSVGYKSPKELAAIFRDWAQVGLVNPS